MFSAAGTYSWFLQVPLKVLEFENLDTLKTLDLESIGQMKAKVSLVRLKLA